MKDRNGWAWTRILLWLGLVGGAAASLFLPAPTGLFMLAGAVLLAAAGTAGPQRPFDWADWPMLLLLAGTLVFSRAFSYLALPAGGLSLYITELLLAAALALLTLKRGWPWRWGRTLVPRALALALGVHFGVGLVTMAWGVAHRGGAALRDAPFGLYALLLVPALGLLAGRQRLGALPRLLIPPAVAALLLGFVRFFINVSRQSVFWAVSRDVKMINLSLVFGLILVFALAFHGAGARPERRRLLLMAYLAFLFLVMTEVRASWMGLLAALLLLAFLLKREMRIVLLLIALVVVSILLIDHFDLGVKKNKLDALRGELNALAVPNLDSQAAANIRWRLSIWRQTWEAIRQHPILGWGYGTQIDYLVWGKRLSFLKAQGASTGILPAHNHLLAVMYKSGAIGLGVFLAFNGFVFFLALRLIPRCRTESNRRLLIAALAGFTLWHGMALFFDLLESPPMSIFLWTLIALILAVAADERSGSAPPPA